MLPIGPLPQRPLVVLLVRASFGGNLSTSPRSIAYALSHDGVPPLLQFLLLPIHLLHLPTAAVADSRPEPGLGADRC